MHACIHAYIHTCIQVLMNTRARRGISRSCELQERTLRQGWCEIRRFDGDAATFTGRHARVGLWPTGSVSGGVGAVGIWRGLQRFRPKGFVREIVACFARWLFTIRVTIRQCSKLCPCWRTKTSSSCSLQDAPKASPHGYGKCGVVVPGVDF